MLYQPPLGRRPLRSEREFACRCRANMAQTRQSRPDSGLDVQVKDIKTICVVPSSLGSGPHLMPPLWGHALCKVTAAVHTRGVLADAWLLALPS